MLKTEITRLIKAFGYSCDGLAAAWREDRPFRLEIILSFIFVPAALALGDTGPERAALIAVWTLVPIVELLNSGLEAITDYATHLERHDLAKKTKDVGSAAVFLASVTFIIVWTLILLF